MKLNEQNYFSHEAEMIYFGSSSFKRFEACEAAAVATYRGDWKQEPSPAMLVGSYVDAHFSGTMAAFRTSQPGIFKRDGSLKSEFEQANEIIARIERDDAFMAALSGEQQVIMVGEIEGVPFKVKIDSLLPHRIVDLKIMRDMADIFNKSEREWEPFWRAWNYDIQGAIYREVVRQNIGVELPFGLAVATREKPEPDIDLIDLPPSALDEGLEIVRASIVHYDSLRKGLYDPERCEKCDFCRSTKKLKGWRDANA